jgi:hypothetical protein
MGTSLTVHLMMMDDLSMISQEARAGMHQSDRVPSVSFAFIRRYPLEACQTLKGTRGHRLKQRWQQSTTFTYGPRLEQQQQLPREAIRAPRTPRLVPLATTAARFCCGAF